MKPLFHFLVTPLNGRSYNNEVDLGNGKKFIISASQEDHTTTQRIAVVIEIPMEYKGAVKLGDQIVVHHNIFRVSFDQKGREKPSSAAVGNGTYLVEPDLAYMYRSSDSDDWKAINPFIFIEPVSNDNNMFDSSRLKQLYGTIAYSANKELPIGQLISFTPDSEYEFKIDGRVLYRMREKNITLIEEI